MACTRLLQPQKFILSVLEAESPRSRRQLASLRPLPWLVDGYFLPVFSTSPPVCLSPGFLFL
jgi:hypothetical protein